MKHTDANVRQSFMDNTVSFDVILSASTEDPAVLTKALEPYANVHQITKVIAARIPAKEVYHLFRGVLNVSTVTRSVDIIPKPRVTSIATRLLHLLVGATV